jgi:dethiobiotin synthetase
MLPIFITGIGTDVGKTIVAAILAEALGADYWKPVQAGYENGTDSEWIKNMVSSPLITVHPETYKLCLAASPHIAAREEGIRISLDMIANDYKKIQQTKVSPNSFLIIEGAGGLLVPLNEDEFVIDLIKKLDTRLIIVSRNYLGSINHSMLTARLCQSNNIPVTGWIFNDQYLQYEQEIVNWSGISSIASIPFLKDIGKDDISRLAKEITPLLNKINW